MSFDHVCRHQKSGFASGLDAVPRELVAGSPSERGSTSTEVFSLEEFRNPMAQDDRNGCSRCLGQNLDKEMWASPAKSLDIGNRHCSRMAAKFGHSADENMIMIGLTRDDKEQTLCPDSSEWGIERTERLGSCTLLSTTCSGQEANVKFRVVEIIVFATTGS